jgi:integrase
MESEAMAIAAITKRTVDASKPEKRDYFVWDEALAGFGLKVTPAGGKVYLFQYRVGGRGNPTRRYTIGKHGALTPDQARTRAKALAAMVEQGVDPRQQELDTLAIKAEAKRQAEEKARVEGELAFEKMAERWLEEYELDHRPNSVGQAKVSINKYLLPKLRGKPLPHITKADLQAALDAIPAKQKATRQQVFAYASILWRWALERGDIEDNPVPSMAKPKVPKSRDRVLSDEELVTVWQAAENLREPFGAYCRLLILTGQRREEVASIKWAELDRAAATWTIPAAKAKNGVTHIVPLSPAVIGEFDQLALAQQVRAKAVVDPTLWPKSGPVVTFKGKVSISCFSQAKAEIDCEVTKLRKETGPLPRWQVRDLRRTLATGLQRLGVRFEVTEAVINHVSGAKGGVAGIYQQHDWKDEKRTALEAWARHVRAIVRPPETDNVVPISVNTVQL